MADRPPVFNENAELQTALETRYVRVQNSILGVLADNKALADRLHNLEGLTADPAMFGKLEQTWLAEEQKSDDGYFNPILRITLPVEIKRGRGKKRLNDTLVITINHEEQFQVTAENIDDLTTIVPGQAANHVEDWLLALQEDTPFDLNSAIEAKQLQAKRLESRPKTEGRSKKR